jgi:ribose/xylose/arabinose/galactoside ABC-type transport system permease subunit
MAWLAPGFATPENFANVLLAMLPLLIVASGQTVVLVTAGIDLSVTSIVALTSVAGAAVCTSDGGWLAGNIAAVPVAILLMLAIGAIVGGINGSCVATLKMPPFMVTLTTMIFISGLAIWLTQSRSISGLPSGFLILGKNIWVALGIAIAIALSVEMLLSRTLLGLAWRAIGSNPQTARVSGVHVTRSIVLAYVTSGICAAIASILITAQLESGSPSQWENNLLDVIGATVIGGTSLFGGRGSVWWTAGGVLLLSLIDNSLNLLNLSHFTIMITKGSVILLAAYLDTLRHRMRA